MTGLLVSSANGFSVAEPIALELRRRTGNIYLHAQIFTGFMYVAAAICMLLLRAWKIGQIETIVEPEGKSASEVGAMTVVSDHEFRHFGTPETGSIVRRLYAWKKV